MRLLESVSLLSVDGASVAGSSDVCLHLYISVWNFVVTVSRSKLS